MLQYSTRFLISFESFSFLYTFVFHFFVPEHYIQSISLLDCGTRDVENGQVDFSSGTLFGQTASVTCNEGYNLSGAASWNCVDDGWNDTASCIVQGKVLSVYVDIRIYNFFIVHYMHIFSIRLNYP